MKRKNLITNLLASGLMALGVGTGFSGTIDKEEVIVPENPKTFCEYYNDLLNLFTIYKGDNPVIQEFAFTGRYQGQIFHNTSDRGFVGDASRYDDNGTDWYNRRFRFGFKSKLFNHFELATQLNLDPTWEAPDSEFTGIRRESGLNVNANDHFFRDVDFLELTWIVNDTAKVRFGKIDPGVTLEDNMSSNRIITLERSSASEMVNHDKTGGVALDLANVLGNALSFGVYNDAGSARWDLPQTNGRWGYQAKINRDITDRTNVGLWWFHAEDADQEWFDRYRQGFANLDHNFEEFTDVWSINSSTLGDGWGLYTDVLLGNRDTGGDGIRSTYGSNVYDDDGDFAALIVMPYYDLTEKLRLVYRFQNIWGENTPINGVDPVDIDGDLRTGPGSMTSGTDLHSHYFGLNWYICGERLKIMNGIEYTRLNDDNATTLGDNHADYWSYQTGIRLWF